MQLAPGILFHNRYHLIEMKGRGSFGEVWLAHDEDLDMDVAVKVYIALDESGVDEFRSEYKTTYGLHHPNLLHANHFDLYEKRPYLVMPYCPSSAANYVGNIDEPTLWRFVRDVASGLEYLHAQEIVHHDIKPDNVLIDTEGNFLITDFGISKKMRSTLRRNSSREVDDQPLGGSIAYMGPEMFSKHPESVKATDIWALGATLYELCEGEIPFFGQGGGMQLGGAAVPEIQGPYSDDLKRLVQMCLAKDTWDRPMASQLREYAQAKLNGQSPDFLRSILPYSTQEPGTDDPGIRGTVTIDPHNTGGRSSGGGTIFESGDEKKKPKVFVWIAALAAVAAVVVVLIVFWPKDNPPKSDDNRKDNEIVVKEEDIEQFKQSVKAFTDSVSSATYENKGYKKLVYVSGEMENLKNLMEEVRPGYDKAYDEYVDLQTKLENRTNLLKDKYAEMVVKFTGPSGDVATANIFLGYYKELDPSTPSDIDVQTFIKLHPELKK